jgi:hypothetical protein
MSDLYLIQGELAGFEPEWVRATLRANGSRVVMAACDLVLMHGFIAPRIQKLIAEEPGLAVALDDLCRYGARTLNFAELADRLRARPALYEPFAEWFLAHCGRSLDGWLSQHGEPGHPKRKPTIRSLLSRILGRPLPPATA